MLWALIIAIVLQIFAYLLYKVGQEVLEDDTHFKIAVGTFFVLFMVSGVALRFVLPSPGASNVASIGDAITSSAFANSQLGQ